jgi:Ca2+-binding EF-hand superfamily protein
MKTLSTIALAAAIACASLSMLCAAAETSDQPPTGGPRESMREHCKSDPQKCQERMQQMKERAEAWWKKVDADGDGKISRDEAAANAPHLAKHFDKIDTDHDGTISREELKPQ